MQFIEAGPDVPVDLVIAQERGEALFVCGAGVSRMVRLPLFRELVENVYLDRPAFRRHPVAIIDGNDRGVYGQQQAVHR